MNQPRRSALIAAALLVSLSGCFQTKQVDTITPVAPTFETEYKDSLKQNQNLELKVKEQKQLISKLQMSLLVKHAELSDLTVKNERLIHEIVRHKTTIRNRGNKVETVSLIAEVTALIKTARENSPGSNFEEVLIKADKYLAESKQEIDKGNFEGAGFLARQALDQVQSIEMLSPNNDRADDQNREIGFFTPLQMKVLENSNVRQSPSMKGKIRFVQQAGSKVTATGYQGLWVKVVVDEQQSGWIHHSLLASAFE